MFFSIEINFLMIYDFYSLILLFVLSYLYKKKKTEPIIFKIDSSEQIDLIYLVKLKVFLLLTKNYCRHNYAYIQSLIESLFYLMFYINDGPFEHVFRVIKHNKLR